MQIEIKQIADLIPYHNNPRINDGAVNHVASSIAEFGFKNPLVIDDFNVIVCGHTRLKAALKLGLTEVPCIKADDLTPAQIKAFRIADNKTNEFSIWDYPLLGIELAELKELDFDYDFGFDEDLFAPDNEGLTDDDYIPEEVEPICKTGDLWLLGEHRLLCGDATKKDDVERLMGGEKADMVFTDPPYGVAYTGKTKDAMTIENDALGEDGTAVIITKAFDHCDAVMRDGAYCLATVPPGPLHLIFAGDWKKRGWLRQIMVWVKDSMVLGHSEYHYKHEPILFGWKPGERLKSPDRTKTTVWEFDRPKASREHPTMKPVSMWVFGIETHSKKGNLLYEPFSGSGTTILACEKTGRKCYGMELDPIYCDVIVKRWEDYTGNKAVKL